jgi:hypothetical protein
MTTYDYIMSKRDKEDATKNAKVAKVDGRRPIFDSLGRTRPRAGTGLPPRKNQIADASILTDSKEDDTTFDDSTLQPQTTENAPSVTEGDENENDDPAYKTIYDGIDNEEVK